MKLLVTTSQSLLLVDTGSGSYTALDRGRGLYYGIAEADGKLFVASRQRAVSSDTERESERGQILVFDRNLQPLGLLTAPFPLRDLHEIAWHKGKLYASCSHDNMVAIYDGANWEQWFPLGGSLADGVGPGDINHFNSFFFEDGRIWVLAHNRGPSELLAFSLETRELVERVDLGNSAHNIWREKGKLFTCSSIDGRIISEDGFVLETGGFPRGVAFAPGLRCVGISAMAERKARDFTTGKLALYDEAWRLQKEIVLQDEGLVLDVQLLPPGYEYAAPQAADDDAPLADKSPGSFYRAYEDRNRGSRDLIKSRLTAYRPFFEPWVSREPAPSALDLGCGRGEWLEVLREAGYAPSGVDLDEGMLAGLCRRGFDVRRMDALQALRATPDASLALVSAFHLVEHIPFDDVRALIREALRVLKPGGLLILETPNPENLVVGSNLFYQDPTHLRPLPTELLRFAVEFEGFKRHIVARLQEDASLHGTGDIGLWTVLEGASPDYAVIGQKPAEENFLRAFNPAFDARYGLMLPGLANRYDMQERRRTTELVARADARTEQFARDMRYNLDKAEEKIAMLEARLEQLESFKTQIVTSPNWKLGAPLRWLGIQVRLMRQMGPAARLKMAGSKIARALLRRSVSFVDRHPGLRRVFVRLIKASGLYGVLRKVYARLSRAQTAQPLRQLDPSVADMSERSAKIYHDLKAAAKLERSSKETS
ncbi:MAG TPA: methyltransferase domain-containing protein [Burkholderiaceae bacterium]